MQEEIIIEQDAAEETDVNAKVPTKQAIAEIDRWLDYKKVTQNKRKDAKDSTEVLVEAVKCGDLVLNHDTMELELILKFPIKGTEQPIKEYSSLRFKPRVTVGQINQRLRGVKATDSDQRLVSYVAAITSQPTALIEKLDTVDAGICQAIATFFI